MAVRLTALGTGNAQALNCYNTCFLLENEQGVLLCDCGGGNELLRRLKQAGHSVSDIHHLIITHAHCDHLLGAVWLIRMAATAMNKDAFSGELRIYCHPTVAELLTMMCRGMLQGKMTKHFGSRILFCPVSDGAEYEILGEKTVFFDIGSTKMLQFGFTRSCGTHKLCCLGDEPYNAACESYVRGSDWLLCEAFCLYDERDKFKPYEKHHSTVKEACELAQSLQVPHLVLWHTEDSHIEQRKALYGAEGRRFYSGDLYVPDDMDVMTIDSL